MMRLSLEIEIAITRFVNSQAKVGEREVLMYEVLRVATVLIYINMQYLHT